MSYSENISKDEAVVSESPAIFARPSKTPTVAAHLAKIFYFNSEKPSHPIMKVTL